jgi:glycosyltransferase involved in cell wall biosynthesis
MLLSVVINTKNAGAMLDKALKSVAWADQIVVMDMHSTDDTKDIAQKHDVSFYTHPDVGYVEPARNAAIAKAKGEWVLILDADEEVPKALANTIKALVAGDATAEAYYLPRQNIIFNQWYQHAGWWPDYQLRLFKKGVVEWSDKIHQAPKIIGAHDYIAATEDHAIVHHHYQTVEQFIDRLNRYTSHEVSSRAKTAEPISSQMVLEAFSNELMSRMFQHRGIDGGLHGVSLSLLQSMYEVVVSLKQWQQTKFVPQPVAQEQAIKAFRRWQSDLNYWIADWHINHSSGLTKLWWRARKRFKI